MRKFKNTVAKVSLILCMFLLVGWGEKAVELLNDTSLIDLRKAIKDAPIGNQGNTLASEEIHVENDNVGIDSQTESNHEEKSLRLQDDKKVLYIIKIRDRTITYNNCEYNNIEDFKEKIKNDCSDGTCKVSLVDDYAENEIYEDVLEILKQLNSNDTIRLEYSESSSD